MKKIELALRVEAMALSEADCTTADALLGIEKADVEVIDEPLGGYDKERYSALDIFEALTDRGRSEGHGVNDVVKELVAALAGYPKNIPMLTGILENY